MKYERWMLETHEAGCVVSRAFFSSEDEAEREKQQRQDQHIGLVRSYTITRQELDL